MGFSALFIWAVLKQNGFASYKIAKRVRKANGRGIIMPLRHVPGLEDHNPLFCAKPGRVPAVAPINSGPGHWLFRFAALDPTPRTVIGDNAHAAEAESETR